MRSPSRYCRKLVKAFLASPLIIGRVRTVLLSRLDGFHIGGGSIVSSGCLFVDGLKKQAVNLANNVDIREHCIFYIGEIDVGSHTFIGRDCFFHAGIFHSDTEPGRVQIGQNCDIAPKVTFLCGTHMMGERSRRAGAAITKDITVGDGVWIGSNTTILPGVCIGSGSVVGAGSIVTKDVPPNVVVAGNPARIIRRLS